MFANSRIDSSSKAVLAKLVSFVSERRLEPGDRLPSERELAERFGVGRNAIREAIATLASLRVLEARPQSGIYFRGLGDQSSFEALVLLSSLGLGPTESEVAQTMEVRASLERTAIELACARRDDDDLADLQRILDETKKVLDSGGNIVDQDQAFHHALVSAGHNEILLRILNTFYELTLPRRRLYFADPERGRASHEQHKQIVDAIRARATKKGITLMHSHMETAKSYWHHEFAEKRSNRPAQKDRRNGKEDS